MKILKLLVLFIIATFIFNSCTSEVETIEDEMNATQESSDSLHLSDRQRTLHMYDIKFPLNTTAQDMLNFRSNYINEANETYISSTLHPGLEIWLVYDLFDFSNCFCDKPPCPSCVKIKAPPTTGTGGTPTIMYIPINAAIPIYNTGH